MRSLNYAISIVYMLLGVALPSASKDSPPTFVVADWVPIGWEETGEPKGLAVEIVTALNNALETSARVVIAKVPRMVRGINGGDFDFTISYRQPDRYWSVNFLADIGCFRTLLVSMKDSPVGSIAELNGKRIAHPGGGYFVEKYGDKLNIRAIQTSQSYNMFNMALRGRVDAFIVNDAIWQTFRNGLYSGHKITPENWARFSEPIVIETLPIAISVSIKSKQLELAKQISTVMDNSKFVAELQRIYERYGLKHALQCHFPNQQELEGLGAKIP